MGLFGDIFGTIGSIIGGNKQAKAAKQGAQLQYDAAMKGIAEEGRQFDVTNANYAPYRAFGEAGLKSFSDLAGLNGDASQLAIVSRLRESPLYKSLFSSGEDAILANASATGGLRGGNTQQSLYHLGEETLAGLIERQLATFGGAIGVGSGATGATATFGANAVAAQNALRGEGAGAQAQAKLIGGGIAAQNWMNAGNAIGGILDKAVPNFGFKF